MSDDTAKQIEERNKAKGKRNMPPRPVGEGVEAAAEQLETRKWRHLTATEWQTIRVVWESGNCTSAELSKRFNVHPETIMRKMKKMGVKKGSGAKRYVTQVQQRMQEKINGTADELADKIRETKDNYSKWNKTIAILAMKELADARAAGKPMSAITQNMRTYEIASNVIAKTRAEQFTILGIDKDDEGAKDLPDLLISEMTADEIEMVKSRMDDEDLLDAAEQLAIDEGILEGDEDLDLDDDVEEGDAGIEMPD